MLSDQLVDSMVETKEELIKSILRWAVQDIAYLQEATGLFALEIARSEMRFQSLFSREKADLNSTAYGISLTNAYFEDRGFEPKVIEEIKAYHTRLEQMSIEELEAELSALRQQNADREEAQRPFNGPESELKRLWFWVRKSTWESWEAILLLALREPSIEVIKYLNDMSVYQVEKSPFATAAYEALELLESAKTSGEISANGQPLEYLRWFEKMKWDIPNDLRNGILEIHDPEGFYELSNHDAPGAQLDDLSESEKQSLLKLVAGMAIGGYRFDTNAARNQATADIQSDLDKLGIGLDQKTILKWLRAATAIIPRSPD